MKKYHNTNNKEPKMCAWWGDLKNNLIQTLLAFQRKMTEREMLVLYNIYRTNTLTHMMHTTPLIKHIILIGRSYLDTYAANEWTLWWHNKVCIMQGYGTNDDDDDVAPFLFSFVLLVFYYYYHYMYLPIYMPNKLQLFFCIIRILSLECVYVCSIATTGP